MILLWLNPHGLLSSSFVQLYEHSLKFMVQPFPFCLWCFEVLWPFVSHRSQFKIPCFLCHCSYLQIENLLEQLKDKDKQLAALRERVQGLQTDSSNTETALTTLEEALSEKVPKSRGWTDEGRSCWENPKETWEALTEAVTAQKSSSVWSLGPILYVVAH